MVSALPPHDVAADVVFAAVESGDTAAAAVVVVDTVYHHSNLTIYANPASSSSVTLSCYVVNYQPTSCVD